MTLKFLVYNCKETLVSILLQRKRIQSFECTLFTTSKYKHVLEIPFQTAVLCCQSKLTNNLGLLFDVSLLQMVPKVAMRLLMLVLFIQSVQSRPLGTCNTWFNQDYLINGCRLDPFHLQECAQGMNSRSAFHECFFPNQPDSCRLNEAKIEHCIYLYPYTPFSSLLCFVLPNNWHT